MLIGCIGHSCVYVKTNKVRLLIDPWLTDRLDRMWVHWPKLDNNLLEESLDVNTIILTHHHCDHHDFNSLRMLSKTAKVFFPASGKNVRVAGSGMGHQAIAYTLQALGFKNIYPLENFVDFNYEDIKISTFPSKVEFPEQSFFIRNNDCSLFVAGDCILHPKTEEFFSKNNPNIDLAFVPTHSTSPHLPLTNRKHDADYSKYIATSQARFKKYCKLLNPKYVVPSALGWKIDATDEENFSWGNHLLFPLTIDQTPELVEDNKVIIMGPGDKVEFKSNNLQPVKLNYDKNKMTKYSEDITFIQNTKIPAFQPSVFNNKEYDNTELLNKFLAKIPGSGYWNRALESNRRFIVRISNKSEDDTFLVNLSSNSIESVGAESMNDFPFTWISSETLKKLLDSSLLIQNSYGLWTSNDMLLSSIFHHPKYYIDHLSNWIKNNE